MSKVCDACGKIIVQKLEKCPACNNDLVIPVDPCHTPRHSVQPPSYPMICTDCGRSNYQHRESCPACGGKLEQRKAAVDRVAFGKRRAACQACLYYGTFKGRKGCGMLARACAVDQLWVVPRANWCPMGFDAQ